MFLDRKKFCEAECGDWESRGQVVSSEVWQVYLQSVVMGTERKGE